MDKRNQIVNLNGYNALVTGGRLKIGFETALKLLRSGAKVMITTRFEDDAWIKFSRQSDFSSWKSRLSISAVDFRSPLFVKGLIHKVNNAFEKLDILINNAAQTIRRPPNFYRHLVDKSINEDAMSYERTIVSEGSAGELIPMSLWRNQDLAVLQPDPSSVARLAMIPLLPGDEIRDLNLFPENTFDKDGQQEDRRSFNSWMMKLENIHLVEFLEVMHINVIAPFLLCSRLKRKMVKKSGAQPSFIVNVSAMEGNFADPEKSWRHPHTNMAKAALNMMTRTSAMEFRDEGIFMTAVDPGYITNEKPFPLDIQISQHRTKMALDEIDGAARLCDPVFRGVFAGELHSGVLLKNYQVYPW